jgi:anti-sigma B factor antagonist
MRSQVLTMSVRKAAENVFIIDVQGEITVTAENSLMDAYTRATSGGARTIILNFERLDYMNSSGIGLLVTLLIRANRQNQRLLVYGLSDHYRQIFELTRLNEAIGIYENEQQALASVGAN